MIPRISDGSKWVRGIGCEPAERGAEGEDAKKGEGSAEEGSACASGDVRRVQPERPAGDVRRG
jgi:hypothetical protein